MCLNNDGGYTCHCYTGWELNYDGWSCDVSTAKRRIPRKLSSVATYNTMDVSMIYSGYTVDGYTYIIYSGYTFEKNFTTAVATAMGANGEVGYPAADVTIDYIYAGSVVVHFSVRLKMADDAAAISTFADNIENAPGVLAWNGLSPVVTSASVEYEDPTDGYGYGYGDWTWDWNADCESPFEERSWLFGSCELATWVHVALVVVGVCLCLHVVCACIWWRQRLKPHNRVSVVSGHAMDTYGVDSTDNVDVESFRAQTAVGTTNDSSDDLSETASRHSSASVMALVPLAMLETCERCELKPRWDNPDQVYGENSDQVYGEVLFRCKVCEVACCFNCICQHCSRCNDCCDEAGECELLKAEEMGELPEIDGGASEAGSHDSKAEKTVRKLEGMSDQEVRELKELMDQEHARRSTRATASAPQPSAGSEETIEAGDSKPTVNPPEVAPAAQNLQGPATPPPVLHNARIEEQMADLLPEPEEPELNLPGGAGEKEAPEEELSEEQKMTGVPSPMLPASVTSLDGPTKSELARDHCIKAQVASGVSIAPQPAAPEHVDASQQGDRTLPPTPKPTGTATEPESVLEMSQQPDDTEPESGHLLEPRE
jgi:hypothetical protein